MVGIGTKKVYPGINRREMENPPAVAVVMPSYFDIVSAVEVFAQIQKLDHDSSGMHLFIIDESLGREVIDSSKINSANISIISLGVRMGAQSAVTTFVRRLLAERSDYRYLITMDSDGEDQPQHAVEILNLLERGSSLVLAARGKRESGLLFPAMYRLYQGIFFALTGATFCTGTFAGMETRWLSSKIDQPEFDFSFSGAIAFHSRDGLTVRYDRGRRLRGKSRMRLRDSAKDGARILLAHWRRMIPWQIGTLTAVSLLSASVALTIWLGVFSQEMLPLFYLFVGIIATFAIFHLKLTYFALSTLSKIQKERKSVSVGLLRASD